jgi:RND family efflux transporter MFP subunit
MNLPLDVPAGRSDTVGEAASSAPAWAPHAPPAPPPVPGPESPAGSMSPAARAGSAGRVGLALQLQAAVLSHARSAPAATAFATELAIAFGCTRVSVGFVQHDHARVRAVSHGGGGGLHGEAFDAIAAAMDEALEQGISVAVPFAGQAVSAIRLAHLALAQRQGGAVATVPLVHLQDSVGAVTLEWARRPAGFEPLVAELEHLVSLIGPVLHLLHVRETPWLQRTWRELRSQAQRLRTPAGARLRLALGGTAVVLPALLLVPINHRVGGPARIEGEAQRTLVAPVDGYLKTVAVRPGDRVREGQVLIELAEQDLQLERRKWASEQSQQESAHATALTRSERAAMVMAMAKADEARARLAMIDAQLARSRIVAPFDGVVLQGDLSQGLGAPVARGEALMTVAPGERHRVVIEVDEREIGQVRIGQPGELALSSLPWEALAIRVQRVTPIARSVDGRNVFEVEAQVTASPEQVRAGLQGVAKIDVGRQSLAAAGWTRLGNALRLSAWRWLP